MLEAKKNLLFEKIFAVYNRNLLKRRFQSLRISGFNFLENLDVALPIIIYANHSSWWDGLVIFEILRGFDFDSFVMMEEKQLKKLYLFRLLGAFSVVRENPREAIKSVNYAADLLKIDSKRTLLIFPQGEILPNDARPIIFFNGLAKIIEKVGVCNVVPAALRYEFAGNYKPEIFVKIGAPEKIEPNGKFDTKIATRNFEKRMTETLDELKNEIVLQNTADFYKIFD